MRVQGEGHPSALVAFIGHRPMPEERELDPFLNGTDLPARDQVFITHLACAADWLDLEMELNLVRPDILVPLGETATRALLGTVDINLVRGIPVQVGCFIIFPVAAPALPSSERYALFACDLIKLGVYLHAPAALTPSPIPQTGTRPGPVATHQDRLWAEDR